MQPSTVKSSLDQQVRAFRFVNRMLCRAVLTTWVSWALVFSGIAVAAIPPTPADDFATTNEDQPISFFVVINDTDPDGTVIPTTITLARGPAHGFALIDDLNGVVVYVPAADYNGPDSVDYQICDNDGECAVATLFLTVLPRNDAPRVRRDVVQADAGASMLVEPLLDDDDFRDVGPVMGSGTAGGINAASTTLLAGPFHGDLAEAVPGIPGRYHYTPDPAFFGLDSFQYRVCDLGIPLPALCATAWVQVTVTPLPAFDPNKPLDAEAWPGAPLVLGGWGEERSSPGTFHGSGEKLVSHLQPNTAQILLVYDQQGALVYKAQGTSVAWNIAGYPDDLKLLAGEYVFAWWVDPAVEPWPQRHGKWRVAP